ncbi:MAG: hypothetical protein QNK05_03840 [Myxococcota bacterium]|nr:hypothetical protein [Myxococcota bacterium]
MESSTSTLRAPLGFTRVENVGPDDERPGLLRARTLAFRTDPSEAFDFRTCVLHDCVDPRTSVPDLEQAGFESIDLTGNEPLQAALARVRDEDCVSDAGAAALRSSLDGGELPLSKGRVLRVLHVAGEGLIQRRAGPNGLDVNPGGMDGANGHDGARGIHADQDVFGTPLRQLMKGAAPSLFRHRTPDACNPDSSVWLLNLWIPIQQITRPLVLMDRRTLDPKRHQLRYGLPVTRFLDRDEESRVNDIWTFLPDPAQEWYFRSDMGPERAWVFDTLGTPHGATVLPGEDALEELYQRLDLAREAVASADARALRSVAAAAAPDLADVTTDAVRKAWRRMADLLREAAGQPDRICASGEEWSRRAGAAMDAVVRKSVEMRLVARLEPGAA